MSLSNKLNKIKEWYKVSRVETAIVFLIILVVLLLVGIWRQKKVSPQKEPIRLSHNISFATSI
ncbi:MAG: hypothetical protein AAB522_00395 [Patescibacteria group bacterium]